MFNMSKTFVSGLAAKAASAANSDTCAVLDAGVADDVRKHQRAHSKKRQTLITAQISSESLAELERIFPESDIVHEINSYHAHGIAQAAHQCEYEYLLTKSRANRCRVVDGGGASALYVGRGYKVHSCSPCLSIRDKQRHVRNNIRLKEHLLSPKESVQAAAIEALSATPNEYMCDKPCEECDYKADVIITCHSAYDFTLTQQCKAMISHDCNILYGTFLFEPAMLVTDTGHSPLLNYEWDIKVLYCTDHHPLGGNPCNLFLCPGHEVIDYFFLNDLSFGYRHDFTPILYMFKTMCHTIGKDSFVFELHENRSGIQFYEITRVPTARTPSSYLTRRIHFPSLDKTIFVRTFQYNDFAATDADRLYTRIQAFPERTVTLARRYIWTHRDDKITLEDVMTFVSSTDANVTVNGAHVQIAHALSAELCRDLVLAIFMENTFQRHRTRVTMQNMVDANEKFKRAGSSRWYKLDSWRLLFSEFWDFLKGVFSTKISNQSVPGEKMEMPSQNWFTRAIFSLKNYEQLIPLFKSLNEPITYEQFFDERPLYSESESIAERHSKVSDPKFFEITAMLSKLQKVPNLIPTTTSIKIRNELNSYLTQIRNERLFNMASEYADDYGRLISDIKDFHFYYELPLPSGLCHDSDANYEQGLCRTYFDNAMDIVAEDLSIRKNNKPRLINRANVFDVSERYLNEQYRLGNFKDLAYFLFVLDDFGHNRNDGSFLDNMTIPWLRSASFWLHLIKILPDNQKETYKHMASLFNVSLTDPDSNRDLALANYYFSLDKILDQSQKKPAELWNKFRAETSFREALFAYLEPQIGFDITLASLKAIEIFSHLEANNMKIDNALFIGETPGYFHDIYTKISTSRSEILTQSPQYKKGLTGLAFNTVFSYFIPNNLGDIVNASIDKTYDFICCDIGSEAGKDLVTRERAFNMTFESSVNKICSSMNLGGHAVIKIYGTSLEKTRIQITTLFDSFEHVVATKLKSSSAYSTERYLFCSNYGRDNLDDPQDFWDKETYFVRDLIQMHQNRLEQCIPNYKVPNFKYQISDWIKHFLPIIANDVTIDIPAVLDAPENVPNILESTYTEIPFVPLDTSVPKIKRIPYNTLDIGSLGHTYAANLIGGAYLSGYDIGILNSILGFRVECFFYDDDEHTRYTFDDGNGSSDAVIYVIGQHAFIHNRAYPKNENSEKFESLGEVFDGGLESMAADGNCMIHAYKILTGNPQSPAEIRASIAKVIISRSHKAGGPTLESAAAELSAYWEAEDVDNKKRAKYDWREAVKNDMVIYRNANLQFERDSVIYLKRNDNNCFKLYFSDIGDLFGEYELAYDGKEFVTIESCDSGYLIDTSSNICYVSRHTVLIQGPRLFSKTRGFQITHPAVILHSGIAGAGKTTDIISRAVPGDLIITALKCSRIETQEKVQKTGKEIEVATVDSYLINSREKYNRVFFDEAFVVHAGYVGIVAGFTCCSEIHCYGDPNQIPALARVSGFRFRHNKIAATMSEFQNVSKRCPLDVCRAVNKYYQTISGGKIIQTRNPTKLSLKVVKISNTSDIPKSDAHYVVWTQAEKKTLKKQVRFQNIKTIHEKQGSTVKHLVLIRTNTKTNPLFESIHHAISAITRHTRSFTYYTQILSKADAVIKLISQAPGTPLEKFQAPEPFPAGWDDQAGGVAYCETLTKMPQIYDQRGIDIRERYFRANQHVPVSAKMPKIYSRQPCFLGRQVLCHSAPTAPITDILRNAQLSYDSATGMPVEYNEDFQAMQVENGDVEFNLSNLRWKLDRDRLKFNRTYMEKFDVRSNLRTAQPYPRPRTRKQTLLALQKRNANAFRVAAPCDPKQQATEVVSHVLDVIGVPDWRAVSDRFKRNPACLSREAIDSYLISIGQSKWHTFEQDFTAKNTAIFTAKQLASYQCTIKIEPKNRLDPNALGEFQPLQTVIHHDSFINLLASFFRIITERLLEILDPRVCVQIRKSQVDLENHFNTFVGCLPFQSVENDFGKFDKSQFDETYCIEEEMFKVLGLDEFIAWMWANSYLEKDIRVVEHAIKMVLYYQRNSGTVTTGLGNVIVNIITTVYAMRLRRDSYRAIYAVGDDSNFILTDDFCFNPEEITTDLATYFNLESKILTGMGIYFCSAFFVFNGQRWYILPDPIKKTERLTLPLNSQSASDTYVDRWNSLRDLCKHYTDANAAAQLNEQCLLRYGRGPVMGMIHAIVTAMGDFKSFMALFQRA